MLIQTENSLTPAPAPSAQAAAIELEHIWVEYRAPQERIGSFKEYAIRLLQGRVQQEYFNALRDVSLTVKPGEVFGVIGQNGAGKSTLLKVLSRVMRPTRGRVIVRGRLAPLLELGAGFHPELTGRENVFLNGTLLGYSHTEVEALLDEIVEFAELGDFIDAPLRTYSTGMTVRLGFAVATATRPDLLLVDEVLAVGDERFQEKCAARMTEFRQNGTTILLVAHNTRLVLSMCDRAVWLDHGQVAALGNVAAVVDAYHEAAQALLSAGSRPKPPAQEPRKVATGQLATAHLEELAMQQSWLYDFELPSGRRTPCILAPEVTQIHETRWQMLRDALAAKFEHKWDKLHCLDLGCGQGYFSIKLAQEGCAAVLGVDARAVHISDADLLRRVYGLDNLQFRHLELAQIMPQTFPHFDVVLLFGLLYQLENPLAALRLARRLAQRVVLIETQLAPDQTGEMCWGAAHETKRIEGSFALLDRTKELDSVYGSLTPWSLCPGHQTLLWLLEQLEFAHIEILPPPADGYEQLVAGERVMIAAWL